MAAVDYFGRAARSNIYWYDSNTRSWVSYSDDAWQGYDENLRSVKAGDDCWVPWTEVLEGSDAPFYKWFSGARTNAAFNEVDVHIIKGHGSEIAYFEDPDPMTTDEVLSITRKELFIKSAAASKELREKYGLKTGDCVLLYMPTCIEQIVWVEACKRLGVIYSCCNPGLPQEQIGDRIVSLHAKLVLTLDHPAWGWAVEAAVSGSASTSSGDAELLKACSVLHLETVRIAMPSGQQHATSPHRTQLGSRVHKLSDLTGSLDCPEENLVPYVWKHFGAPVDVEANFPLFVTFTSGTTGKPKGVAHVHAYLVGLVETMKVSFSADPQTDRILTVGTLGWITGQSYQIAAVLASRITTVLMQGSPVVPKRSRFAEVINKYKVTIFKAGSAFLREVMAESESMDEVKACKTVDQLKVATFCAEPVSPVVQEFAMQAVCKNYINSYWASEHGGIAWSRRYGDSSQPLKADAHTWPMDWIDADVYVFDESSRPTELGATWKARVAALGERAEIVCTAPYPYMFRYVWGDVENLLKPTWTGDRTVMLSKYWRKTLVDGESSPKWVYIQGDYATKYEDGSYTLHGRSDEVLNVNGILYGTEHIEGAILRDKVMVRESPVSHCVVVGYPNNVSGEVPLAFVQLVSGRKELRLEEESRLRDLVVQVVGKVPMEFCPLTVLPQTFSGKFMRRLLRDWACGKAGGDASMLSNPSCADVIKREIAAWQGSVETNADAEVQDDSLPNVIEALLCNLLTVSGPMDHSVTLMRLGVNSTMTMSLRASLQAKLGIRISMQVVTPTATIASLSEKLAQLQSRTSAGTPKGTPSRHPKVDLQKSLTIAASSSCTRASPPPTPASASAAPAAPQAPVRPGVARTAVVDDGARIAQGCSICDYACVEAGAEIKANAVVERFAVIKCGAIIGEGCLVGTGTEVGARVELGANTRIGPYCHIGGEGRVLFGTGNNVHSNCRITAGAGVMTVFGHDNTCRSNVSIGNDPEDYVDFPKPAGDIRIGNSNTFCENVVIHAPYREIESPITSIGNHCYLMANVHVAHDNILEDRVVLAAGACLAGFVRVMYKANVGIGCTVHQDTTIGPYCIIGMGTPVTNDVLPFTTYVARDGQPQGSAQLNSIGLSRSGKTEDEIIAVEDFYTEVYNPAIGNLASQTPDGAWYKELFQLYDHCRRQQRRGGRTVGSILFGM